MNPSIADGERAVCTVCGASASTDSTKRFRVLPKVALIDTCEHLYANATGFCVDGDHSKCSNTLCVCACHVEHIEDVDDATWHAVKSGLGKLATT